MRPRNMFRSSSLPVSRLTPGRNSPTSKINLQPTIYNSEEEDSDTVGKFKQLVKCLNIPSCYLDDDYFYLKWLRARGYDLEKAKEMLDNHLEWRETCTQLHGIMNYVAPKKVLEQVKWKRLGEDPDGRPIYCLLVGRLDITLLTDPLLTEDFRRYIHKILELVHCDSNDQRRVTGYGKAIGIVDMSGFTFSKAMSITLIQMGIYFARVFEANYPETLYRCYVINASWFFTSVYNAIKPFLSAETVSKIQILGSDQSSYLPQLESTIPNDLLPEDYGGTADPVQFFEEIV